MTDPGSHEIETLQEQVIEVQRRLLEAHEARESAERSRDELTTQHRIAYSGALRENAALRRRLAEKEALLKESQRTAAAMQAKLQIVYRFVPAPARRLARRWSGDVGRSSG